MKTIARRHTGNLFGLCSFLLILFFAIEGCNKHDTSITSPAPSASYPSVAANWKGNGTWDLGINGQLAFSVDAAITEKGDTLGGNWTWTYNRADDRPNKFYFDGTIQQAGTIALAETSWVALSPEVVFLSRPLAQYTAALSSKRDTISGTSTNSGILITFTLVRQ